MIVCDERKRRYSAGKHTRLRPRARGRIFPAAPSSLRDQLGFDRVRQSRFSRDGRSVQRLQRRGRPVSFSRAGFTPIDVNASRVGSIESLQRRQSVVLLQRAGFGLDLRGIELQLFRIFLRLDLDETIHRMFHRFSQIA